MAVEYKVGDNVRILDASKIERGLECFNTGDITKVLSIDEGLDGLHLERTKANSITKEIYVYKSELEFIEIVDGFEEFMDYLASLENKVKLLEKRVKELESKTEESKVFNITTHFNIEDKMNSKEFASKIIEAIKKRQEEDKVDTNQLRKQVIENAKELIGIYITESTIINVNNETKTVTAVLVKNNGEVVTDKAKFNENTSKVYNEYIGGAIALSKIWSLDYSKFENIVEPNEVVVGMKLEINDGEAGVRTRTVGRIDGDKVRFVGGAFDFMDYIKDNAVIIDDSSAEY